MLAAAKLAAYHVMFATVTFAATIMMALDQDFQLMLAANVDAQRNNARISTLVLSNAKVVMATA